MAHNGSAEQQQGAALSTPIEFPVNQSTGETQINVGLGSQGQPVTARVESQGNVSSQVLGSQQQNTQSTAEMQIPQTSQGAAGPQTQSASTTDKLLETMNNMVSFMASQQQQQSLAATNAPSVSLSSLRSMTVDTKGILTVDDYWGEKEKLLGWKRICLLYTSPSPRDRG